MLFHRGNRQQRPSTPPRRDVLGFFKSVVEFFTGVIGMTTAALGILGTVAAFALAGSAPPEPRDSTPTPTGSPETAAWVKAVNEQCAAVHAEIEDPFTFSILVGALAEELRSGPTPPGFEDEVASAADDFELSAIAAAAGDGAAELHANNASTTLSTVGVDGC